MAAEQSRLQGAAELATAGRQAWDVVSQWLGRDGGSVEVTLLFTELSDFPSWVLKAGDERALELLREVATVVEPCITERRGKVVKRLSHGHMAVFRRAGEGLDAALSMQAALAHLPPATTAAELSAGLQPRLRAGLHSGQPRRMGRDYLGADVNIAARIAEAARAGEVLVSGDALAAIDAEQRDRLEIKRRRAFRAKGAPPGLKVYRVVVR